MPAVILIVLDVNLIDKKIFVKKHFCGKKVAGRNILPCPALCPALVALLGKQGRAKNQNLPCRAGRAGQGAGQGRAQGRAALPCDGLCFELN